MIITEQTNGCNVVYELIFEACHTADQTLNRDVTVDVLNQHSKAKEAAVTSIISV